MTRILTSLGFVAFALLTLVGGCSESEEGPCGAGDEGDYEGSAYCAYRGAIIEEGFTCPARFPHRYDFGDLQVCGERETPPEGLERHVREGRGLADAAVPESDGGESPSDGGEDCWEGWEAPRATTEASTRPDPSVDDALRMTFRYGRDDDGQPEIVLETLRGERVVRPGDGPFDPETTAGTWVELRSAADETLYTQGVFELVPESFEAPAEDGGFVRAAACPENDGLIFLMGFANHPDASQLVFFAPPLDGSPGGNTRELARFSLP